MYLLLHNASAVLRAREKQLNDQKSPSQRVEKAAVYCLRFSVTAWLLTCGIAIIFTMARHPQCTSRHLAVSPLNVGSTCLIHRTTVAASLAAL